MYAPVVEHFGYMADMISKFCGTKQVVVVLATFKTFPETVDLVRKIFFYHNYMAHIIAG